MNNVSGWDWFKFAILVLFCTYGMVYAGMQIEGSIEVYFRRPVAEVINPFTASGSHGFLMLGLLVLVFYRLLSLLFEASE